MATEQQITEARQALANADRTELIYGVDSEPAQAERRAADKLALHALIAGATPEQLGQH
jgi:hypothetical protein